MTQCLYRNFSYTYIYIYILFALACLCDAWQIPSLIPFSVINMISQSVINYNFTSVFFKQACHANTGADTIYTGSRHIYIKTHISKIFKYICKQ